MTAKVIAFINYKGGVAKTTTTYHIGCSLVQHFGKRVLLIDIDPQTNLTFLCSSIEDWEGFKKKTGTIATMYRRFIDKQSLDTKRYIWRQPVGAAIKQRISHLDLIPCDIDLIGEDLGGASVAGSFPTLEALRRQSRDYLRERSFLQRAIREVEDDYDYILIDCPPNLYLMTQNALLASNWYVVTAIPDHLSTIGLNILQRKVRKIGDLVGSAQSFAGESGLGVAEIGGIVFVRVRLGGSRITIVHQNTMATVKTEQKKGLCFGTYTTELIGYGEAAEQSLPVWMTQTKNAASAATRHEYEYVTKEFVRRFKLAMTTRKRDIGFFQSQKFVESLSALLEALPSEASKQQALSQLEILIEFLRDLRARVEKIPTQQDAVETRAAVDGLKSIFSDAKSNPILAAAFGIQAKPLRQNISTVTADDIDRAKLAIARFDSMPIDAIRSALEQMSSRDLQVVAKSVGLRTTQRTTREALAHQVATKITNTRGYRSLRDGENQP